MGLEQGNFISDLVTTNPEPTDKRRFGDDHLRLIKLTLRNTFPNLDAAARPTADEMNALEGVQSSIQTQLDAKLEAASIGISGGDGIDVSGALASLTVAVDGTVLRTTGAQSVAGVKTFSDRPIFNGQGGFVSHANSTNSGGRVIIQGTVPADTTGLNPGDIVLVY